MIPILQDITQKVEQRLEQRKKELPLRELEDQLPNSRTPHNFLSAFKKNRVNVISEIKFASPSQGAIVTNGDPAQVACDYLENGAAALSILTEQDFFGGSIQNIKLVREKFPQALILRKDFIIDAYQIMESRLIGADAILLIASLLDQTKFTEMLQLTLAQKLTPLVEVHHRQELEMVLNLATEKIPLIGINNRNLKTMSVDLKTSLELKELIPPEKLVISESGIKTGKDIKKLMAAGFDGFLIGTAFMRSGKPGQALQQILQEATA